MFETSGANGLGPFRSNFLSSLENLVIGQQLLRRDQPSHSPSLLLHHQAENTLERHHYHYRHFDNLSYSEIVKLEYRTVPRNYSL